MSIFNKQIVDEYKNEISKFCSDLSSLSNSIKILDQAHNVTATALTTLQDALKIHTTQIFALQQHFDDQRPRDVIGLIYFYAINELILQKVEQQPNLHLPEEAFDAKHLVVMCYIHLMPYIYTEVSLLSGGLLFDISPAHHAVLIYLPVCTY